MKASATPVPSPRLVVVGSSNTDLVLSCNALPKPGETVLGGVFQEFPGGKGANQAVAAARAGAKVAFIGARGNDSYGNRAAKGLLREKIDIRHFKIHPGATSGIALILVGGKSRQNMIAVARSTNDLMSTQDIHDAAKLISTAAMVIAQLEVPLAVVLEAARLARSHGVPFLLNPAPARKLPRALFRLIDLLVPNEHEAMFLTGHMNPERATKVLLDQGCRRVVMTLGKQGALLAEADRLDHFAAPRVKAVDTVGAGDCFTGWLAVGLSEGLPIAQAITQALRAASLSVTRAGAQPSFPHRNEIVGT